MSKIAEFWDYKYNKINSYYNKFRSIVGSEEEYWEYFLNKVSKKMLKHTWEPNLLEIQHFTSLELVTLYYYWDEKYNDSYLKDKTAGTIAYNLEIEMSRRKLFDNL